MTSEPLRIVVIHYDRPAAVLISLEDLESMEETLQVLSDPEVMREIVEAEAALRAGDVIHGVEAVRTLRNR